ncbi:hypothetical protein CANARDRAFT_28214 [[Candida] arabinofermentans NRRL YB-2248]|uniref:Actin n=1 Tax=[Candida] arabinofermentans NRRL YB-2248 TaxID=983967 RepID=A0A1E4T0Y4_9ASCO|nr:hypothetical protein CANARDRAFT_28214 [[Candida] arabinofermentans NRRL YB-2248]
MGLDDIYNQPVVIDNGSGMIRSGFAGDEKPKINYSNMIGTPKYTKVMPSSITETDTFIGSKAQNLRGLLKLKYPISRGIVENWSDMEKIWTQVISELSIKVDQHPLLITEQPLNPKKNRDKMCEMMFETFSFPTMYISIPSVLSLYSMGRTTGVVLDSGDGVTVAVPVYEGFAVPGSIKRMNVAGRDITEQAQLMLMRAGYYMGSSSDFEIVRSLKERLCYVDISVRNTKKHLIGNTSESHIMRDFLLPDGKTLKINDEALCQPAEILYNPESFGLENLPINELMKNSIMKTDMDLRQQLFQNIVLCGGSTLIKNFGSRLLNELKKDDKELKLKIFASPERKISCFVGGSILSSLSTFKKIWITKSEYYEDPNIVHKKFL